jgi:hypothetical protein
MDTTQIMEKLVNIERFLGVEPDSEIRRKVIDVEDCVLAMQEERAKSLRRRIVVATRNPAPGPKERAAVIPIRARAATPHLVQSKSSPHDQLPLPPACA